MNMQAIALAFLAAAAIGGVAWVFLYPLLSGERKAENRRASVAKAEPIAVRQNQRDARSRREQIEGSLKEVEARRLKDKKRITMTARLLSQLPILARAEEESAVAKLLRAGATQTARPNAIAGWRMAQAVLHPAVLDADLQMEEQLVLPGSPLDGKTVRQSGLRARRGRLLVAIRRRDGRVAFNPEDDAPVSAGDVLITLEGGERVHGAAARAAP